MNYTKLISEIVGAYEKHGWKLRRVLLRPETRDALGNDIVAIDSVQMEESSIDALWFSRPSYERREAWELRLLADHAFALFETFEEGETEEERRDVRTEMEARLREYTSRQ